MALLGVVTAFLAFTAFCWWQACLALNRPQSRWRILKPRD